jgi:hypothetical protein
MTTLVNEIDNIGCINKLMGECLTHRESYRTLAEALDDAQFERRLDIARRELQRETTDQPAHDDSIPELMGNGDPGANQGAQGAMPLALTGTTPGGIPGGTTPGAVPGGKPIANKPKAPGNPALANSQMPPPGMGNQTPGSPFTADQNLQNPFAGGGTT